MRTLAAAVIAVLAASAVSADENRPYTVVNGRAVTVTPAAQGGGPRFITIGGGSGGAEPNAPAPAQAPKIGQGIVSAPLSDGGRAFLGGGRSRAASRGGRAVLRGGGKAFWSRGATAGGSGGAATTASDPGTAGSNDDPPPPYMTTWGAKILTAGQAPKYNDPTTGERQNTIPAGEIAFNPNRAIDVGKAPSVHQGPKDTLPPPNPGTFSRTYTGGIAANGPATTDGSGSTGGTGGGHDNNGSGNNDKDHPGDGDDGHGGAKSTSYGSDPTGFYSAY